MSKQALQVGDKVRLTGKYLKSTGQQRGGEGQSVWLITALSGPFVVTNERLRPTNVERLWTPAELEADPSLWFRRFHPGNLQKVR